jgi:hypothetical protein
VEGTLIIYWTMFLIPAFAVRSGRRLKESQARISWLRVGALFFIQLGLRHEVGADWANYLRHFYDAQGEPFLSAIGWDPAYYTLNWVGANVLDSIHVVNLCCAVVLVVGTISFSKKQPNPWLALTVAVPYLLIVVGMGYTRQSVALGCVLLGLTSLVNANVRAFVVWVIIGATFHKSAVLMLPIAAVASSKNRWMTAGLTLVIFGLAYYLLVADHAENLWSSYVTSNMESEGGGIRVAMNAVPATLFLLFRRKLAESERQRALWIWISVLSLACVPLVLLASTAVDRIALYFLPLQLFVFSRLPRLFRSPAVRTQIILAILAAYAAVLFIWLNFAFHSDSWLPYQFMPLPDLI